MSIPPFSPFPLADTSYNINLDIGGGDGDGGGGGHPESVVTTPVSWLTTTTSISGLITTYSIDTNGNFAGAVNAVVNTGSFNTFLTWNGAVGSMSADNSTDVASIVGDWTSGVGNAGTHYIKTSAVDNTDTMTISFEKFLHEGIDSDDDTVITAAQKAAVLKFEGGLGIVTSAALDNLDTKVTIAVDPNGLDTMQLVQITNAAVGSQTIVVEVGDDISCVTYPVRQLTPSFLNNNKAFDVEQTGVLYDFSTNGTGTTRLNAPNNHTGTNPTYTFQTLEEGTILSAKRVHAWGNVWIRGGIATLDFACE